MKLHVGPVVVVRPSSTVTYHSYCVNCAQTRPRVQRCAAGDAIDRTQILHVPEPALPAIERDIGRVPIRIADRDIQCRRGADARCAWA